MTTQRLLQALFLLGVFLTPITGGHLVTDSIGIQPGQSVLPLLFGGSEAAQLGYLLPSVLVLAALAGSMLKNRVVQVPFPPLTLAILMLAAFVLISTLPSAFKGSTVPATIFFLTMLASPFAAMVVLGRNEGPKWALMALAAGCGLVAVLGIQEYAAQRAIDPTWRIFSTWVNPNALAGMLMIGFILAIGLACVGERVEKLLCGSLATIIGIALVLTQSKGGYLAVAAGLLVFGFLALLWGGKSRLRHAVTAVVIVAVVGVASIGISRSASTAAAPGAAPALGRVAQSAETQEQSQGFRVLLWRSAADIALSNPIGTGLHTFRFESPRPGLVASTVTAHQGFLQLAAEAGPAALIAFLAALGIWVREMFRSGGRQAEPRPILKAAVLGAVAASLAHNMVDSDLQHFGTGFALFLLIGIGMQIAADAVTPEPFPNGLRSAGAAIAGLLIVGVAWAGALDVAKAQARGAIEVRNVEALRAARDRIAALSPSDPDVAYADAVLASDPESRLEAIRETARRAPTLRNLRSLAQAEAQAGNEGKAQAALAEALVRDPNNLLTHKLKLDLAVKSGSAAGIREAAERLIQVESTPVFQIRAIPELVPTETYFARYEAASVEPSASQRIVLLEPALDGMVRYARTTAPKVISISKTNPEIGFANERIPDVQEAMALGNKIAELLDAAYRETGAEESKRRGVADAINAFSEVAGALGALPK